MLGQDGQGRNKEGGAGSQNKRRAGNLWSLVEFSSRREGERERVSERACESVRKRGTDRCRNDDRRVDSKRKM